MAPGVAVRATFQVTAPARANMGFLTLRAAWNGGADVSQQRVRSVEPVKLNEVRFASGGNATDQFIELYNAGSSAVDISGWRLVNTRTWSAPVTLVTIPAGTTIAPRSHYLLGLANSGLASPAAAGATTVNLRSTTGLSPGAEIVIGGESRTVKSAGTAATAPTKVFINVSTGPWLDFPAGTTNLPVHSAEGFAVGQKIGIDLGGNTEIATVTVGRQGRDADHAGGLHHSGRDQHQAGGAGQCQRRRHADHQHRPAHGARSGRFGRHRGTGRHRRHSDGAAQTAAYRRASMSGAGAPAFPSRLPRALPIAAAMRCRRWAAAWCSTARWPSAHAYGAPVRYPGVANEGYQGPAPHSLVRQHALHHRRRHRVDRPVRRGGDGRHRLRLAAE